MQSYDFGSWFNVAYTGTKIPKFEDVIKLLSVSGIRVSVSLHGNLTDSQLDDMCDILVKYGQRNCTIKSNKYATLSHVFSVLGNDPEYVYDHSNWTSTEIDNMFALGVEKLVMETNNTDLPTQNAINYAIEHKVQVSVYTNEASQMKELISMGVTRFLTD